MSSGKIFGLILGVLLLIAGSLWLGRQNQQPAGERHSEAMPAANAGFPLPTSPPANPPGTKTPTNLFRPPTETTAPGAHTPQLPTLPPIENWSEAIDDALKSTKAESDTAKDLIQLLPRFPTEGKVEALQHISNLLPDSDYASLSKLAQDATQPVEVLDELIADLLNRPAKIMLPEMLEMAKNPQHAKAGEAKDYLELYLEEDYGSDWALWKAKMDEYLKQNPE
jgi:hypothetical protein